MTLSGLAASGGATPSSLRSPFRTPSMLHSGGVDRLPLLSSSSSSRGKKAFTGDDASYGSVLDQLHAEQKSTIEALTYQVEFYRQREDRHKIEVETLRQYVRQHGDKHAATEDAVSVTRLAMDNRVLGDEVDALRAKQRAYIDENGRYRRQQQELEQQLQDAKHSLVAFTQTIEQLELKMQRKGSEVQTQALELEHELRQKTQECNQLTQERDTLRNQLQNLQVMRDENQRLRQELQSMMQTSSTQQAEVEAATLKMSNELRQLRSRLSDVETTKRAQEAKLLDLQLKHGEAAGKAASFAAEVEKYQAEIDDLKMQLQRSSELLELRERLLTSDASTKHDVEIQRQELHGQMLKLEKENRALEIENSACKEKLSVMKSDLEAAKGRLSAKGHGVIVSTLRSEMIALKERLRAEFKNEKDTLRSEKESLSNEVTLLRSRISEKDQFIQRLHDQILQFEAKAKDRGLEVTELHSTVGRLERDLANARHKYEELVDARSSLVDQLDSGFKKILEDENTAATAFRQVEQLQRELSDVRRNLASTEAQLITSSDEVRRTREHSDKSSSVLRRQIDQLYSELNERDEQILRSKEVEAKLSLLEQEKHHWDEKLLQTRAAVEQDVLLERHATEHLRSVIATLKSEKAQQHAILLALQDEVIDLKASVSESQTTAERKELEVAAGKQEHRRLNEEIGRLTAELEASAKLVDAGDKEKGKRERKLLRERHQLEDQLMQLVDRIEAASKRNGELGDKVVKLVKRTKNYETELVAMNSQVKAEKEKSVELERALASVKQTAGMDSESCETLKRRLYEVTSLKESYQAELGQLKRAVDHAQNEKNVLNRQRDEAIKRVSMLVKCQEQMKSTVESHTSELVEEIEAIQNQLNDERKRCTILLGNEKTLLRDITEKNAVISRLQQSVSMLQQQLQHEPLPQDRGLPDVPTKKSNHGMLSGSSSPNANPMPRQTTSAHSASAQELDRLLGNLEHISEFSSLSPQRRR